MIIRNLAIAVNSEMRVASAAVAWEDQPHREHVLRFEIRDGGVRDAGEDDEPPADAFLAACYPLAAVHGEARVRIEGQPCPMLAEGLRTAHAWWTGWGGMPSPAPLIETPARRRSKTSTGARHAVGCLSGGVDGLHMLMRNRCLYQPDDPAYIREALLIHGFDIGKRARDPENERFRMVLRRLEPLAAEVGLRLIPCRTNLRHLPSKPNFWASRHNGAALAAVGHAATLGPAFLFIGGTHHVTNPFPMGTHFAVDGHFSSQRVTVIHDGSRYFRIDKVRDVARWPAALAALRVCHEAQGAEANCGRCEKCLRTRLELLAVGIEETAAFGPSLTPIELWDAAVSEVVPPRAVQYEDLLAPLRTRGLHSLCRLLEKKIKSCWDAEAARCSGFDRGLRDDLLVDDPNSLDYP
jgi:hypothetical protein